MRPVEHPHSPAPEEVMEWLDGEGSPASRAAIESHVALCPVCHAVVSQMRAVSRDAQGWTVEAVPESWRAPATPEPRWNWMLLRRRPAPVSAALGAVAVIMLLFGAWLLTPRDRAPASLGAQEGQEIRMSGANRGATSRTRAEAAPPAAEAPLDALSDAKKMDVPATPPTAIAGLPAAARAAQPMVIRTATLRIVARNIEASRAAIEKSVRDSAGFLDQLTVSGEAGAAQLLHGVLRVPQDRLPRVIADVRGLGQVLEDAQQSEDVTDQVVDLDVRLANARATEQRLAQILKDRTGKLSDVLDVEREIARVRLEIEQLDGQRTNLGRRVSYATLTVDVTEEHKASLDAPLPFSTRLRLAAADGIDRAVATAAGALLLLVTTGPTLVLWAPTLGLLWIAMRRFGLVRRRSASA